MNKKNLDFYRKLLQEKKELLRGEAEKTVNTMSTEKEATPDFMDRASRESDRNFLLRIRDRERKLIEKIEGALGRIEDGDYGSCGVCGEKISPNRLKARPVTTLCIDCKTKQEKEEKRKKY